MVNRPETSLVPANQAASLTGKSVSTIKRWYKEGKLVGSHDQLGRLVIDIASLPSGLIQEHDIRQRTEQSQTELVEEQTTTQTSELVMVVREAVKLLGTANHHVREVMQMAMLDRRESERLMRSDLHHALEHIRTLHSELLEAKKGELEALTAYTDHELAIDEHRRREDRRENVQKLLVAFGVSQLGDEKTKKLADAITTVLSQRAQSGQQHGPTSVQSEEEPSEDP